jgi:hypothetical protein
MRRRIKTIVVLLLLLAAVFVAASLFWINPLVKATLETQASSALGVQVGVESVSIKPLRGMIKVAGVRVGNPAGFAGPAMLEISDVLVQIRLRSLRSKTIVIRRILIDQPELTLERNGESDNLRALLEQLQDPDLPAVPAEEAAPEAPRRIAINEIRILQPRIRFVRNPGNRFVAVTAGSISFRQSSSTVGIEDVLIHNPPGYTAPHLLSVERVDAVAQCPHIGSFRLEGVRIESPRLLREKGVVGDNLSDCRKLVVPFFKGYGSEDAAADEEQVDSAYSWIPGQMVVADGKLFSHNPRLPEAESPRTELAFLRLAVRPAEGVARIRQLAVANPRRFSHAHIVEIEELQVGIDPATLGQDTLRILEIQVVEPRFAYERRLRTDNISELRKNMLRVARTADAGLAETEAPDPVEPESPSRGVVVDHLLVKGGTVQARISKLPSATVGLPVIERFDLGQGEGGASYGTLTYEITGIVYHSILQSVAGIGGMATDAIQGTGNLLFDAGGAVGNTALDAIKGVGGFFKDEE